jgi:hypothetical protein
MAGTARLVLDRRWGSGSRAPWRRGEGGSAAGRAAQRASAGVPAREPGRRRAWGWASAVAVPVLGRRGQVDEEEAGH